MVRRPTALHPPWRNTDIYRRIRYLLCIESSRVPYKMISSSLLSFSRGNADNVPRRITLYLASALPRAAGDPLAFDRLVQVDPLPLPFRNAFRDSHCISRLYLSFLRLERFRSTRRSYPSVFFFFFVNSDERL